MNEKTVLSEKIGIFGGSFCPPHKAHIAMAIAAARQLKLHKIIFLIQSDDFYKDEPYMYTAEQRLEMLKTIDDEWYFACPVEFRINEKHYLSEAVEELKKEKPNAEFSLILGADSLESIPYWANAEELCRETVIGYCKRSGCDSCEKAAEYLKNNFGARVEAIEMRQLDISSSEIRERLKKNESVEELVPACILGKL